jgi:hypothetical protein
MLRERLRGTIPKVIENEVERAVRAADRWVRDYLIGLRKVNWATLRATVRRGGTWIRSRPIDLPNELALRFEDPLALAWNRGVVGPLRRSLQEFATDLGRLLEMVVAWAGTQGGLDVAHVERFQADVAAEIESLGSRGELAAADLTKLAKQLLHVGIQDEIRTACQEFQDEGLDVGTGVKDRVTDFLEQLSPRIAQVARVTATRIFREAYDSVLAQVTPGLQRFEDPLAHAKALLLGGEERIAQGGAQRRDELGQIRAILGEMAVLQAEVNA